MQRSSHYRGGMFGSPIDFKEAERLLLRAAESGHPYAYMSLGEVYSNPESGLQDIEKAIHYYQAAYRAAEFGDSILGKIMALCQKYPGYCE